MMESLVHIENINRDQLRLRLDVSSEALVLSRDLDHCDSHGWFGKTPLFFCGSGKDLMEKARTTKLWTWHC